MHYWCTSDCSRQIVPANMPSFQRGVKRLANDALKDTKHDSIRKLPGVAYLQDNFPRVYKDLVKDTRPLNRKLGRQIRQALKDTARTRSVRRESRRTILDDAQRMRRSSRRHIEFSEDVGMPSVDLFDAPSQNMPHGSRSGSRASGRGSVKSRSRNIKTNLSLSRPMRTLAKRSTLAEVKYITANADNVVNGTMLPLSTVAQGTTNVTRVGDELRLLGCNVSARIQIIPGGGHAPSDVVGWRLTIFQWHQNNVNPPVVADIYDNVPPGHPSLQYFNLHRKPQFTVLSDQSGYLAGDPAIASVGGTTTGVVKMALTPPRRMVTFKPGLTSGDNQIYALFQASVASGAGIVLPECDISWRTSFTDE